MSDKEEVISYCDEYMDRLEMQDWKMTNQVAAGGGK